jgi:hypothetical protein
MPPRLSITAWASEQVFHLAVLEPYLIIQIFTHIKKNFYTAQSFSRVMDLHHGFNLCGLDQLWLGEPSYCRRECMPWSSSSVQREHREIEKIMQKEINFTVINDKFKKKQVDGVKFDTEQLFRDLVHHFGLSEKAKHASVELPITVDWAPLYDQCGHMTIWFKIVDKDAIDPISENNNFRELDSMQSCNWCFPLTMLIAKDDKDSYDKYLRDIFKFCDRLRTEGLDEWKPFKIADPQDMTLLQLCLTRGGAAKAKHYLCNLYQIQSDDRASCNETTGSCTYAHTAENGHKFHHERLVNVDCIVEARREVSGPQAIAEVHSLSYELRRVKSARVKNEVGNYLREVQVALPITRKWHIY